MEDWENVDGGVKCAICVGRVTTRNGTFIKKPCLAKDRALSDAKARHLKQKCHADAIALKEAAATQSTLPAAILPAVVGILFVLGVHFDQLFFMIWYLLPFMHYEAAIDLQKRSNTFAGHESVLCGGKQKYTSHWFASEGCLLLANMVRQVTFLLLKRCKFVSI